MSKRRRGNIYTPSETHLALHPPRELISCPCGITFVARVSISPDIDSEDDPKLCLSCNRRAWSRLWNDNQPVAVEVEIDSDNDSESELDTEEASRLAFDLTSDSDIGEVVSMIERRPRR